MISPVLVSQIFTITNVVFKFLETKLDNILPRMGRRFRSKRRRQEIVRSSPAATASRMSRKEWRRKGRRSSLTPHLGKRRSFRRDKI